MCLITRQEKPIIAEADITVYKLMKMITWDSVRSMHQSDVVWEVGETKNMGHLVGLKNQIFTVFDKGVTHHYGGEKGWDGISTYDPEEGGHILFPEFTQYKHGFHWGTGKRRFLPYWKTGQRRVIVQCTVPKGAEVAFDETGLGVSNILRIDKIHTSAFYFKNQE